MTFTRWTATDRSRNIQWSSDGRKVILTTRNWAFGRGDISAMVMESVFRRAFRFRGRKTCSATIRRNDQVIEYRSFFDSAKDARQWCRDKVAELTR